MGFASPSSGSVKMSHFVAGDWRLKTSALPSGVHESSYLNAGSAARYSRAGVRAGHRADDEVLRPQLAVLVRDARAVGRPDRTLAVARLLREPRRHAALEIPDPDHGQVRPLGAHVRDVLAVGRDVDPAEILRRLDRDLPISWPSASYQAKRVFVTWNVGYAITRERAALKPGAPE